MVDTAGIINGLDDLCQRVGFDALSQTDRMVCLVNWLRFEVEMGGLASFYQSSSGDYAPLTVDALRDVGAPGAADALGRANALIQGPAPHWPDRTARQAATSRIDEATWKTLRTAMKSDGPPDWADRLDDFVARNVTLFAHVSPSRFG